MQLADVDGRRSPPSPGARGTCPACGGEVLAKCGSLTVWHWAHRAADCDPWSEPESDWHLGWKRRLADIEHQEVTLRPHRADVIAKDGRVVELQNSPISVKEVAEREAFYTAARGRPMLWIVNMARYRPRFSLHRYHTEPDVILTWTSPARVWWTATCPVFLDLGSRWLFRALTWWTKDSRPPASPRWDLADQRHWHKAKTAGVTGRIVGYRAFEEWAGHLAPSSAVGLSPWYGADLQKRYHAACMLNWTKGGWPYTDNVGRPALGTPEGKIIATEWLRHCLLAHYRSASFDEDPAAAELRLRVADDVLRFRGRTSLERWVAAYEHITPEERRRAERTVLATGGPPVPGLQRGPP